MDQPEILKIEECGNLPENWLEYLSSVKKSCKNKEDFQRLLCLYERASNQIPAELKVENIHFAKLLVDYAKLQSKVDPERARATFKAARNCCEKFAIVYVASADFEFKQGRHHRCRQLLHYGKECKAEPLHILTEAYKNAIDKKDKLIDEVTEEQTFFNLIQQENMKLQNARKNSDTDTSGGSVSDSGELYPVDMMKLPSPPTMSTVCPILPSQSKVSPDDIVRFKPPPGPRTSRLERQSSSSGDDVSDPGVPPLAPLLSGGQSSEIFLQRGCMSAQKLKSTPAELPPHNSTNLSCFSARKSRVRRITDSKKIGPPLRIPSSVKEQLTSEEVLSSEKENDFHLVQKPLIKQTSTASTALKELQKNNNTHSLSTSPNNEGIKPLPDEQSPEILKPQIGVADGKVSDNGIQVQSENYVNKVKNEIQFQNRISQNELISQTRVSQEKQLPSENWIVSQSRQSADPEKAGACQQNRGHATLSAAPTQSSAFSYDVIVVNGKKYTKLGLLGKGGSSKVFHCLSAEDGKTVAIKYVSLEHADDMIIQSYLNEITLLKRLQGKENIISLFDWEITKSQSCLYLVMECGDIDLNTYIRKNREQLSEVTLLYIWEQMLQAVNDIHEEGIIHCDLKPANFLSVGGKWKLIDFGISNAVQDDNTSIFRDTHIGTLNYMSPEAFLDISQQSGQGKPKMKIGRPSDVWSLGCILYLIVYGKTPFQHITNNFMKRAAIIDPDHLIQFPENKYKNKLLQETMKGCLCRDPSKRKTIPYLLSHNFIQREVGEHLLLNRVLEAASPRTATVIKGLMENLSTG